MIKLKPKTQILIIKICVVVFTLLFGIFTCATSIAVANETQINDALGVIAYKIVQGSSENVDSDYYKSDYDSVADLVAAGRQAVEDIEAEGVVLLKNENSALPLSAGSKISLFGVASVDPAYGGKGSAQTDNPQPPVTPQQGFTNAGFSVNSDLVKYYSDNLTSLALDKGEVKDAKWADITAAVSTSTIATYGDAAIMIISRVSGEGADMWQPGTYGIGCLENNYLNLGVNEADTLKGLKAEKDKGNIKKIIVLFNTANQIETSFLDDAQYGVDAALWIGTTGITGFNAVGKIIKGDITPSGKLSDTYWYKHSYNPVNANFGGYTYGNLTAFNLPNDTAYSSYVVYQEGIYVGYRYAETRYYDVVTGRAKAGNFVYGDVISHPFGYGESYTDFEYSDYSVEDNGNGTYTVSVKVTNTGKTYSGKEAVQIYVQKPFGDYDIQNKIEKSAVDLVGYAKTKELAPDESDTLTITVNEEDFAVYDTEGAGTYVITAGDYYIAAGTNSHDAVNNILAAQSYTKNDGMDADGNADLTAKFTLAFDDETYSVSANGTEIHNLFDAADPNKYFGGSVNTVNYLSRTDWAGTFPSGNVELVMRNALQTDLMAQSAAEIEPDDTAYPTYGKDSGLQLIDMRVDYEGNPVAYDDPIWDTFLDQLSWDDIVTLLSNGYRSTAMLEKFGKPFTRDHNGPSGIVSAYGDNNGIATKTEDPDKNTTPPYYPCLGILASTFNDELATLYGEMLGEDALWAGYAGFYGIGLDTHRSAYEGRAYEYYSEDPYLAGSIATKEVIALQNHGCNAYIKHFALNEQETYRWGISVWVNEQSLREIYLKPFEMAVTEGNAMNAMASFTRIGATYCPASKALISDFLKGECGMKGLVVTDMYESAYKGAQFPMFVLAGTDIPDGTVTKDAPFTAYKTGYGQLAQAMREAAHRILYATVHSNAMNGITSDTKILPVTPAWKAALISADVIFGVLLLASVSWAAATVVLEIKKQKSNKTN